MINLRLAIRYLRKRPLFTVLNLLGLVVGLGGAILIGQYVQHEYQTDAFIPEQDRTYRMLRVSEIDNEPYYIGVTSAPFQDGLLADFPEEIEESVRVLWGNDAIIRVDDELFIQEQVVAADSNVVSFFGLSLERGHPDQILDKPNTAILTPASAERLFGKGIDPIGQSFQLDEDGLFTVQGIVAPPTTNSHLSYDIIVSSITYADRGWWSEWWANTLCTYVRLAPDYAVADLEERLPAFMDKYFGDDFIANGARIDLRLEPINETYFAAETRYDPVRHGNARMIGVFALVALFLIGIACANYINLSTAKATERRHVVAIQRTLGAERGQIRRQLLWEGGLLALVASAGALVLSQLGGTWFSTYLGFDFPQNLSTLQLIGIGVVAAAAVTILAAWLPASFISRFKGHEQLSADRRETGGIRKVLVAGQFVLSIALICGTLVIQDQLQYLQEKPLGFEAENVLSTRAYNDEIYDERSRLKDWLEQQNGIAEVSFASGEPGGFHDATVVEVEGIDHTIRMRTLFTDAHYLSVLNMELIAGRMFEPNRSSDSTQAAVINRRALTELGLSVEEAMNRRVTVPMFDTIPKRIIGVVEDYHFTSLHSAIEPLFITQATWPGVVLVKAEAGQEAKAASLLQQAWDRFSPNYPLSYAYLDDQLGELYLEEQQQGRLLSFFTYLAIFVSCLGIFGLSAYAAVRRRREVSIRKVLGASVSGIVSLLTRDFLLPIGLAFVIAVPMAWLAMSRWLETFTYHTTLNWQFFALAGALATLIALLTVSFHSIRAALVNPAESLKRE